MYGHLSQNWGSYGHFEVLNKFIRVTKVVADYEFEFSSEEARPKNYEHCHKNIFGLSVVLELKVENSKILIF